MTKRQGLWALFVLLLVASAVTALIAVIGVVATISGNLGEGTSRVDGSIGDGVFLVATALLAWGARRVEHRARGGGAATGASLTIDPDGADMASSGEAEGRIRGSKSPSAFALPRATGTRNLWGRRRLTPHSHLFYAFLFGALSLLMVFVAVMSYRSAHRSTFVQQHGISAAAMVVSFQDEVHSTRSGSYTTVNVVVQLTTPVDGHSQYTIHSPASAPPAPVGGRVTILIDRNDLSYAELPGEPMTTTTEAVVSIVIVAVLAAVAVIEEVLHLRHKGAVSPPG